MSFIFFRFQFRFQIQWYSELSVWPQQIINTIIAGTATTTITTTTTTTSSTTTNNNNNNNKLHSSLVMETNKELQNHKTNQEQGQNKETLLRFPHNWNNVRV